MDNTIATGLIWWCPLVFSKKFIKGRWMIFISIDDNEVHNLRLLMNEILVRKLYCTNHQSTGTPTGGGGKTYCKWNRLFIGIFKISRFKIFRNPINKRRKCNMIKKMNMDYLIRPLRRTGGEDRREDRPINVHPLTAPDGSEVFL